MRFYQTNIAIRNGPRCETNSGFFVLLGLVDGNEGEAAPSFFPSGGLNPKKLRVVRY